MYLLIPVALTLLSVNDDHARPALRGSVVDVDGKPIADATVFIYTARVREGTSPY